MNDNLGMVIGIIAMLILFNPELVGERAATLVKTFNHHLTGSIQ